MQHKLQTIVMAGGCFWCFDALYRRVRGVTSVVTGYCGGAEVNPTYEQVSSGNTGHTEAVKITYDPQLIAEQDLLGIFWSLHDPTTLNRQGADVGTQYRSALFYNTEDQQQRMLASKAEAQQFWNNAIVTEITELDHFYAAEDYHQDFFNKHPASGYCYVVINPKLAKLRKQYSHLLSE